MFLTDKNQSIYKTLHFFQIKKSIYLAKKVKEIFTCMKFI